MQDINITPEIKVITFLSEYVRKLKEGGDYEETTYQSAKKIIGVFSKDKCSEKYRLGRKQRRALLDSNGLEVALFRKGEEELAEKTVELLNGEHHCLIKDINGQTIVPGKKFKFKYLEEVHREVDLVGSFSYNDLELRWEIDVWDNNFYTCLTYQSNSVMHSFELV